MAEVLHVKERQVLGTRGCRRMRRAGEIPAVLYGHGQGNLNLAIPAGELEAALRHGSKMVEIQGAVSDSALIREVQWDALGVELLHVDLTRVTAEEAVEVELSVELVGEAPGAKEGGIVEQPVHVISIICPAGRIPDVLQVRMNDLRLGGSIFAKEIPLPEGAELAVDPEMLIAHCVMPVPVAEEEVPAQQPLEPEVITRRAESEEGEDS